MDIYDAAQRYREEGKTVMVLAGKEYGSGSSRDWAAKGPWIQVRQLHVISYTHIHIRHTGFCGGEIGYLKTEVNFSSLNFQGISTITYHLMVSWPNFPLF